MPRLAAAVSILACCLVSSACDDPISDIGLQVRGPDQLTILWNPCKQGRLATSVELEESGGRIVWQIKSERGSPLREFIVGEEPAGFVTVVPLSEELPGVRLSPSVSGVGPQFFDLTEIEPGRVLVIGDGNMSAEEFWARDTCG